MILASKLKYKNRKPQVYTKIVKRKAPRSRVGVNGLYLKMYIGNTLYSIILPILRIITVKGNAVNLTNAIHGFPDHNVDPADMMYTMQIMMQILLNQTSETTDCKDGKSEQTV